jgi:glycosyltransferase involved in cell wall biosynthesis
MVEAMVSGTPVIAITQGAATEVIEPGVTGFLAHDLDGMVEAYSCVKDVDLEGCVRRASDRFGPARMADGYQSVYERAIEEAYYRDRL